MVELASPEHAMRRSAGDKMRGNDLTGRQAALAKLANWITEQNHNSCRDRRGYRAVDK